MQMVLPEKVKISSSLEWKKKKKHDNTQMKICKVENSIYMVPFLSNLKNLLMNDEVRANVDNPLLHKEGIYRSVLDGSYYQQNEFFQNENNPLGNILYYDDLGVDWVLVLQLKNYQCFIGFQLI